MISVGVDIGIRQVAIGIPMLRWAGIFSLKIRELERAEELLGIRRFLYGLAQVGHGMPFSEMHLWVEEAYLSNGPNRNQTTTVGLAETVGTVLGAESWGRAEKVGNSTWKAALIGDGKASKDEIAGWLLDNHRVLYNACAGSQDMMDAMCIGIYGEMRDSGQILAPVKRPKKKRKPSVRGFTPKVMFFDEVAILDEPEVTP